jgi:hypothetical protein
MNRAETLKIFSVIKANYGNHFKNMPIADANAKVELWAEMFADVEYGLVGAAVKSYIASDTSGHPPNVGQINELIRKLTQPEEMTEQEAVHLILKAASNGYYGAEQEFEKLPPVLQRLVGHPSQLRTWAMMDETELQTVVASNLMRSYRVIAKNEETKAMLPNSIKNLLEQASDRMRIEG